MSRFFEGLEAQLDAAARAQTDTRNRRGRRAKRWLRSGGRALPVAFATLATLAVVVVALTLHGRGATPSTASKRSPAVPSPHAVVSISGGMQVIGKPFGHLSPQQQRDLNYVFAAQRAAMKSRACAPPPPPRSTTSQGAPSVALLSLLGVLRRAAAPSDLPRVPHASTPLYPTQAQDIYVRYVRRARVVGGVSYYVIPAGRLIVTPAFSTRRCYAVQVAELRRELPHIPAGQRSTTVALQAQLNATFQSAVQTPQEGICIQDLNASGGGGGSCETTSQVKNGGPLEGDGSTIIGVVPDGVASVTLRYPASHGQPAFTANGRVVGNVFAVPVAQRAQAPVAPADLVWRSASGGVIKTVSPGGS